jgi:hypothetical protein
MDLFDFLDIFVGHESATEACPHVSGEDDTVGGCEPDGCRSGFIDVFEVCVGEITVGDFTEFGGIRR